MNTGEVGVVETVKACMSMVRDDCVEAWVATRPAEQIEPAHREIAREWKTMRDIIRPGTEPKFDVETLGTEAVYMAFTLQRVARDRVIRLRERHYAILEFFEIKAEKLKEEIATHE